MPSTSDDLAVLVAAQDGDLDAGEGPAHRPGADVHGGEVGDHDPAGLGLPPVVVDRQTEGLDAPAHRLRVQGLADAGDEPQAGHGWAAASSVPARIIIRTAVGAVYQTDTCSSWSTWYQRSASKSASSTTLVTPSASGARMPVRHPGDPAGVGRAPEHVVVVQVEGPARRRRVRDQRVVDVDRALRRAGRPAREVEQRHVLGPCRGRIGGPRVVEQRPEVEDALVRAVLVDQHDVAESGQRRPDRGDLAPVERARGDEHAGVAERQALADRLRPEGAEQRAGHGAVLQGAEHRRVQLRDAAGEHEHALAALDAEVGEHVGEPAGAVGQVGIGQLEALAPATSPANGCAVGVLTRMAVDALVGDVQRPARQALQRASGLIPRERGAEGRIVDQVRWHAKADLRASR